MLGIQHGKKRVGTAQVDHDGPGSVAIVDEQVAAGLDVIRREIGGPPAVRDTDLRGSTLDQRIERLGLDPVPNLLREGRITLVVAVVTVQAEAVIQVTPIGRAFTRLVRPDNLLNGTGFTSVVDPDLFQGEEFHQRVAATREEQVLIVERLHQRIAAEGDFKRVRSVFVRNELVVHVAGLEVVFGPLPLDGPVTVGDADLVPVRIQLE